MKQSLSVRSKRILNIINYLLNNKNGSLVSDLANLNKCTVQTIYNDIKYVKTHFHNFIQFESLGNTLQMSEYSVLSLLKIKQEFLKESVSLNILLKAFLSEETTIQSLAKDLNYSEVHIRSKIKEINVNYQEFSFSLHLSKNQTVQIETKDPMFFTCFISHVLKLTGKNILELITEEQHNHINNTVETYHITPEIKDYLIDMMAVYQYYYKETLTFTQSFNEILNSSKVQNSGDMCIRSLNNLKGYTLKTTTLEYLKNSIRVLIALSLMQPQKIDDFLNRYELFYDMYCYDNQDFCMKFDLMIKEVEKDYDINLQIVKHLIIYHLFIHIDKIDLRHSIRIGVYSELGTNHAKVLASIIQKRFMEHTVACLEIINESSEYDFICSTAYIEETEIDKIVYINDYITVEDFAKIFNKISHIHSLYRPNSYYNTIN